MTNEAQFPDEEIFCRVVETKMQAEGRKWRWLADAVGMSVQTLRSQLRKPHTLGLGTAKRIATALDLSVWDVVEEPQAVAS